MFNTKDIILAATLKTLGYQLITIEKNGHLGTFFFDAISEEILLEYDLGNIRVEPVTFNNNIKALTTATRR
jgi:hypothetical protein